MKAAANLNWLYPDLPWPARFAQAAADGFGAVEILYPYDLPPDVLRAGLAENGLTLVLFNTPVLPESPGALGWACVPGAAAAFREAFEAARDVAARTGCRRIHLMAGRVAEGPAARAAAEDAWRHSLEHALACAARDDLTLMLEPLNRSDMPGYFYHRPAQALAVLRAWDDPRLRLQFDLYHVAREGLDVPDELEAALPWIGHVQVAGAPARDEPDLGRHGVGAALARLAATGYAGALGFEYRPRGRAGEGLGWCAPLRERGCLAFAAPA